ncbi:MAG: glycosyltransferase 87 family protein [Alphaproteobacteria bacterium]|nr:glycosyltransferase 87 family protein [Alphaproteobacteria bacterium]
MKNWLKENRYVFLSTFIVVMCFIKMWTYKGIDVSFVSFSDIPVEYSIVYDDYSGVVLDSDGLKKDLHKKEIKKYVNSGVHIVHLKVPTQKMKNFELLFSQPDIYVHSLKILGKQFISFDKIDDFIPSVKTIDHPLYRDTKKNIFILSAPQQIEIDGKRLVCFSKLFWMILFVGGISYFFRKYSPLKMGKKYYVYSGILTIYLMICFSFLYLNTNTSLYKIFALKFFNKVGEITISTENENSSFQILSIFGLKAPDGVFENNMRISKKLTEKFQEDLIEIKPDFNGDIKFTFNSVLENPIEIRKVKINEKVIQSEVKSIVDQNDMKFTLEKQKVEQTFKVHSGKKYEISFETRFIPIHFSDIKILTGLNEFKFVFSFLSLFALSLVAICYFQQKNTSLKNVFLIGSGVFSIVYFVCFLGGIGGFDTHYLENRSYLYDTIGSAWGGKMPYQLSAGTEQYPPLINLIFYVFSNIADFKGPSDTDISGTAFHDLYETGSLLKIQLWMVLWTVLFLIQFYQRLEGSSLQKFLVFFILTLTYPLVNCLHVGNQMIVCAVFSTFYLFHFNDEDDKTRELSYIALAVSAGCKIYPAIFGLLTLCSNRKKEAIRLIVYGIIFFFLPFFFFEDGIANFEKILSGVASWSKTVASYLYSFRGFTTGFWYDRSNDRFIEALFNKQISIYLDRIFAFINYASVIVGLVCLPCIKKNWIKSLFLGLIPLVLNSRGYPYCSVIIFASLVLFLNEEKNNSLKNIVYSILFMGILFPKFLFYCEFSIAVCSNILFILLAYDMGKQFLDMSKNERMQIYKNFVS